jgi:hypothetical protein
MKAQRPKNGSFPRFHACRIQRSWWAMASHINHLPSFSRRFESDSNQSVIDATRVRTFRNRHSARLGRACFQGRPNLGPKALRELASQPEEHLTAAGAIAAALSLSLPPDNAREAVVDAVIALRQDGFRPAAFKPVQVR